MVKDMVGTLIAIFIGCLVGIKISDIIEYYADKWEDR